MVLYVARTVSQGFLTVRLNCKQLLLSFIILLACNLGLALLSRAGGYKEWEEPAISMIVAQAFVSKTPRERGDMRQIDKFMLPTPKCNQN